MINTDTAMRVLQYKKLFNVPVIFFLPILITLLCVSVSLPSTPALPVNEAMASSKMTAVASVTKEKKNLPSSSTHRNQIQRIPLTTFYHPKVENPFQWKVCLIMPAFTKHGGTESWFKTLHGIVNSIGSARFYGVYIWDIRYKEAADYLRNNDIYAFSSVVEMELFCHITISTSYHYLDNPYMYQIQVIHGSGYDEWTWRFARYAYLYDHVVGVSHNSLGRQAEEVLTKSSYIPSYVKKFDSCQPETIRYKFCEKQILFIGRLSIAKRPELFCKALCQLPYCGVLIGPYYFDKNRPQCECENVHIIGDRDDAQCFMRNSDFLFVPSEAEGGPIVAIEAWLNDLPVVMKKTGLAVTYPNNFLLYDWDKMEINELRKLLENQTRIEEVRKSARKTYVKEFSEPVLKSAWQKVIDGGIDYLKKKGVQLHWPLYKHKQVFIMAQGRSVHLNCVEVGCEVGLKVRALSRRIMIKYDIISLNSPVVFRVICGGNRVHSLSIPLPGYGNFTSHLGPDFAEEYVQVETESDQAFIIIKDIISV